MPRRGVGFPRRAHFAGVNHGADPLAQIPGVGPLSFLGESMVSKRKVIWKARLNRGGWLVKSREAIDRTDARLDREAATAETVEFFLKVQAAQKRGGR